MSYDLSEKRFNRDGGKLAYLENGEPVQHDNLTIIIEALSEARTDNFKLMVKMGVIADRLGRVEDHTAVDLSPDDVNTIKEAMGMCRLSAAMALPILKVIDPSILKE